MDSHIESLLSIKKEWKRIRSFLVCQAKLAAWRHYQTMIDELYAPAMSYKLAHPDATYRQIGTIFSIPGPTLRSHWKLLMKREVAAKRKRRG